MNSWIDPAALWALAGGTVYAGSRLSTALWRGVEVTIQAKRLAIAQFVLALILAPVAGAAFTPTLLAIFPKTTCPPVALIVGLFVNAIWPILAERNFLRTLLSDLFRGLANKIGSPDQT